MKIERCRNHELNSNPQAWEVVFEDAVLQEVYAELEERVKALGSSGDQLRVNMNGTTWTPMEFFIMCNR